MNALDLLSAPLAQAIGWALLHLLWQATIVAGILAAALALLSKHSANVRYGVSCAALMLVFALFAGTAWRAYEPRMAPTPPVANESQTAEEQLVPVTRVPFLIAAAATDTWRDRALQFAARAQTALPAVVAVWLAGVIVLSSRLLVSWIHARRLVHAGTRDVSAQWKQVAARLADALGLKRAVQLVESAAVEVPSVIGSLRPVILLPASALTGMTTEHLEMVLAHELAHIRRHDFLVNLLQAVVETLMFYHPAVWWMSRRVRIERENCCDDLAVAVCGNPIQYARALARLEELRAHAPAMAVAANGGSLIDRVRRIAMSRVRAESSETSSRWAAAIAMLSVVVIALAVPSLPALAEREAKDKKKEAPAKQEARANVEVVAVEAGEPADAEEESADTEEYSDDVEVNDDLEEAEVDLAEAHATAIDLVAPMIAAPPAPAAMPAPHPMLAAVAPVAPGAPVMAYLVDADEMDEEEPGRARPNRNRKFGEGGKLTVEELIALRNAGVTPEYIAQMRASFPELRLGDAISLRNAGVSPDYISKMRAVFPELKLNDLISLRNMGVTPQYIADMKAAGVSITSARDANSLAAMGVTTDFVKKLAAAGYDKLTVRELTRLAAAGVDADFIREMSKYRDKN